MGPPLGGGGGGLPACVPVRKHTAVPVVRWVPAVTAVTSCSMPPERYGRHDSDLMQHAT